MTQLLGRYVVKIVAMASLALVPSALAGEFSKRYLVFERGKYGYINETGILIIPSQFEKASDFSEGLASVSVNYRQGYIDEAGQFVIPAQFVTAEDFSDGLAVVQTYTSSGSPSGKWGYIDRAGQQVTPQQFDSASSFSDGLALVQVNGKWGYIDKTGQYVIEPRFSKGRNFSERVAAVETKTVLGQTAWGFIDKTGRVIIQPQFQVGGDFAEGVVWVFKKDPKMKPMAINKQGKVVFIPSSEISIGFFEKASGGLWGFRETSSSVRHGYMDTKGNVVIAPQFKSAREFSEGLAAVRPEGVPEVWGYIDTTGHMTIEPQFHDAKSFHEGLARVVRQDGLSCYINTHGQVVWEPGVRTEQ